MSEPAIIAAWISGAFAVSNAFITIVSGFFARRHEKHIKLEVERQVGTYLKIHEAQLRVAAEWRLKMLERMLDAGGALRMKLNGNFAAINKLSRHATIHGADPTTQSLIHDFDAALREVTTVGGFLTPSLTRLARSFIQRFDAIGHGIVEWSNRATPEERLAGCTATDRELDALSEDMTNAFGAWHQQMWEGQEKAFVSDPETAAAVVAAPEPPSLPANGTHALAPPPGVAKT